MRKKQRGLADRNNNSNNNYSNNHNGELSKILVITLSSIAVILAITFSAIIIIKALNSNKETGVKTEQKVNVTNLEESNEMPKDKPTVVDVAIGDTITLGTYEQDNDISNGKEQIEWRVLAVEDEKALLISEYGLDCKPYNEEYESTTWAECSLREWLNGEFYNTAFSETDKGKILKETIIAEDNLEDNTEAGEDTEDNVFLLSISEAEKYFSSDEDRMCKPTAYAVDEGVFPSDYEEYEGCCWWWLRTLGNNNCFASRVYYDGDIGSNMADYAQAVRPALWIKL